MSTLAGLGSRLLAALFLVAVFAIGADAPALAQTRSSAAVGTFCADEDGRCTFSGARNVYYGAEGRYAVRRLRNGTFCSNGVFGDPAPNVRKACYVEGATVGAARGYMCADEGDHCSFSGARNVYYGANGRYAVRPLSNGAECTNDVFGDPIVGVRKACYVEGGGSSGPHGAFCADEDARCNFSGTRFVYYGAGDRYVMRRLTNGTMCSNAVFGDPAPGVRKSCYVDRPRGR